MSETPQITKSFEESPGVSSSSRVGFYWMMALGSIQIVLGCWILLVDPDDLGAASASWGAGLSTIGVGFQLKNNAKKIEEGVGK